MRPSTLIAISIAGALATPIHAQQRRNVPVGNPLDPNLAASSAQSSAVIDDAPADDPALQAQRLRVARARAQAAQQQMQDAYANPSVQQPILPEEATPPPVQQAEDPAGQPKRGPLPSPFGGGIRVPWGNGIRPPW